MKLGNNISFILILYSIVFSGFAYSEEKITTSPLINLEEIKPSFEEFDEDKETSSNNLNFKSNSDKDIFIHDDQNLLKITSSIIISSTFIFISFLTFAKTE